MMYQFDQTVPDMETAHAETLYLLIDGGQLNDFQSLDQDLLVPIYFYQGGEPLQAVSSYLLNVTPEVKQWFLAKNKPTAGFFFSSKWSADKIVRHFYQLVQVISPYDTQTYLKMAHSEVAWILLNTQCYLFWQPIEKAWLSTRLGWKILIRPKHVLRLFSASLKLSEEQWLQFDEVVWRNLLEKIHRHICQYFPDMPQQQEYFDLWVDAHARIAHQKGFITERDQLLYFNVIGLLGEQAVTSEQYPDIYQLVHFITSETPSQRIEQAEKMARRYASQKEMSFA
ncbi:DUF4123 domain-containing protein [Vibrio sp. PP-XX7]